MKISQIIVKESSAGATTAGGIATVSKPLGEVNVRGLQPATTVMKGKAKKKGPYQNSLVEGKMGELDYDLKNMRPNEFKKKYGKTREEMLAGFKNKPQPSTPPVSEDTLGEEEKLLKPGMGRKLKPGFFKHDPDKAEHEGETLKNSLHTIARSAMKLDKHLSTKDEFPEWVSEKIGAIKSMMSSVMQYLISKEEMQDDPDAMSEVKISGAGALAGGLQYEGLRDPKDNPCWKGYHPVGTKKKNGKTVPNCVPGKTDESVAEAQLDEKAVSKAQQRFMGMAHAIQKGKKIPGASSELKSVAKGMTKKAAHDFAATKHKGLPEKVKKKD